MDGAGYRQDALERAFRSGRRRQGLKEKENSDGKSDQSKEKRL